MSKKSWIIESKLPAPFERINILHRGPYKMEMHSHPYWQVIVV